MMVSCFSTLAMTSSLLIATPDPGLSAGKLYYGVDRPVILNTGSSGHSNSMRLVLLNFDGAILAEHDALGSTSFDLATLMPSVWQLRTSAYLQLMDDRKPIGSSLVLQPMLSRQVPVTEQSVRSDGHTQYTKIVGWSDENVLEVEAPEELEAEKNVPEDSVIMNGLRIYPERDVLMRTDRGEMVILLRPDAAPNTAWNFRQLSEGGFYEGIVFHRVVPMSSQGDPFVIQAGDPTGEGSGGPGYWLPIEPSTLEHDFGVISMARADHPDSAGSQFFFALSREGTARLDGQYCAFGYAVTGARTIEAIAAVELADVARGRPVKPPVILKTTLIPALPRWPNVGRSDTRVVPRTEESDEPELDRNGRVSR